MPAQREDEVYDAFGESECISILRIFKEAYAQYYQEDISYSGRSSCASILKGQEAYTVDGWQIATFLFAAIFAGVKP